MKFKEWFGSINLQRKTSHPLKQYLVVGTMSGKASKGIASQLNHGIEKLRNREMQMVSTD